MIILPPVWQPAQMTHFSSMNFKPPLLGRVESAYQRCRVSGEEAFRRGLGSARSIIVGSTCAAAKGKRSASQTWAKQK